MGGGVRTQFGLSEVTRVGLETCSRVDKEPTELVRLMDTSGSTGGVTTGEERLPVLIFLGMKFEYLGFIFIDFPLAGSFPSCNGIADSDWVGISGEDLSELVHFEELGISVFLSFGSLSPPRHF